MLAQSFQERWLDPLLSSRKKQTTRANDRIKVGDIVHIYNQQRLEINSKPLRKLTSEGDEMMREREYPRVKKLPEGMYHAHFIGKVKIVEVWDIRPIEMSDRELEVWALDDGFEDLSDLGFTPIEIADTWFRSRYGNDWMDRTWYVNRWDGWLERYFDADPKYSRRYSGKTNETN